MPCTITLLWAYLAPCMLGVPASGGCLGRNILSSALRTKDELLPQHRLFTCSYFLGIFVGLQAPLLMGLCRTTPGFSHLKGQVLKILRGQCVVRRQQQVLRFWDTWTKTKKLVWFFSYFMTWLSPGACGPSAVLGAGCNGLMAEGLHHWNLCQPALMTSSDCWIWQRKMY